MKSNQSINAGNFDTFTLFPKLPPELRLKIWKIAASAPKAFTIRLHEWDQHITMKSRQKQSSLMRVNHEARETQAAMLQGRKLNFGSPEQRPIHFNPKNDIIFLQNVNFYALGFMQHLSYFSSFRDDLKLVENLAICGRTHLYLKAQDFTYFFNSLPSLKTLVVYRCEMISDHQQMMIQRTGRLELWMAQRGFHYSIETELQLCWEVLKKKEPSFQAPAVTFMEIGDIEALKSSPENWPMSR
jgi:hypothetical protein